MEISIQPYRAEMENQWLRCRLLAFFDSAYFDDIKRKKETYTNPSFEYVALTDQKVVGLIDLEYDTESNAICSKHPNMQQHLAGMIWHLAVHPDYRPMGIAGKLLEVIEQEARKKEIQRLEAWTRDDAFVNAWYLRNGFEQIDQYIHWYYSDAVDSPSLLPQLISKQDSSIHVHQIYGSSSTMNDSISALQRKHKCIRYDKILS